jgi:hypothetical protein
MIQVGISSIKTVFCTQQNNKESSGKKDPSISISSLICAHQMSNFSVNKDQEADKDTKMKNEEELMSKMACKSKHLES